MNREIKNREIKFRAWTGVQMEYKVMAGFLGSFYVQGLDEKDSASMSHFNSKYYPETPIMQFTGIKDKKGNDIYEGDIVKLNDGGDISHHRIFWDNQGRFRDERLEDGDCLTDYLSGEFDFVAEGIIIGNIYENPELLN